MMLEYYYGLEHKEKFQQYFGNLYIGQHPTVEANSFMVLSFDFSGIDTTSHKSTYQGFLDNVLNGISIFMTTYEDLFTDEQRQIIGSKSSPEAAIKTLFTFFKNNKISHKIYLLIDEYDHFANELLSFDIERFKANVTKNGFVRKFYEILKLATRNGLIGRLFMTGVSPLTMDSMTSGFNIADNISLNPIFHDMMGFTHAEVQAMLKGVGISQKKIPATMSDLAEWYDGYKFAMDNEPVFNPDMILYFLKEYSIKNEYPVDMLDSNIITDYRKTLNMFKKEDNLYLLTELIDTGHIDFTLTRSFDLEYFFKEEDFLSLLFYRGLLTFKEARSSDWRFEIPNSAIKQQYFEYLPQFA